MRPRLAYIAHRLGAGPDREENRLEAERWMEWAARQGVVPIAPWVTLARYWGESDRELCMKLNGEAVRHSDEYWMCGQKESPGMLEQRKIAELYGLTIRRYRVRAPVLGEADGGGS